MPRIPFVAGNWKMQKTVAETVAYIKEFRLLVKDLSDIDIVLAPPFTSIHAAAEAARNSTVAISAQDVYWEKQGAFTGEVSAAELAEAGVRYVEVGHAERRRLFGETDEVVAAKTATALRHGLVPVLCVGETVEGPDAAEVAIAQLGSALAGAPAGRVIVAYEPVWAIGADAPASDDHIRRVCAALRDARREPHDAVIYGGSAGPGLLTRLGDAVDGIFLGRFAHDPVALRAVIDEAVARG